MTQMMQSLLLATLVGMAVPAVTQSPLPYGPPITLENAKKAAAAAAAPVEEEEEVEDEEEAEIEVDDDADDEDE